MQTVKLPPALIAMLVASAFPAAAQTATPVRTTAGLVTGTITGTGIRLYRGIPFAAPPVGSLRWREPQPAAHWTGVRAADQFGPRCMQPPIFSDMVFRSSGMSEDCLYLNVWRPAGAKLPVLVYFYGGGFIAGDGSEKRYDGESLSRRGIVVVTVNYRLGVFGFLAHPELTRASPHHASGNLGLLDQVAALRWVQANIAAFGGDPARVTIGGESAGAMSVSSHMVSPLSRGLFARAICESGAPLGELSPAPLAVAEADGVRFVASTGANSVAALRALSSQEILDATSHFDGGFHPTIDGYFLDKLPAASFAAGAQARVPLLAGWNSAEGSADGILGKSPPTDTGYASIIRRAIPDFADEVLKLYPGRTPEEVTKSAAELATDQFMGYATWKLTDAQAQAGAPVYRYYFVRPRPGSTAAVHSAEIEYALGNLDRNLVYKWTPSDYAASETMESYFANFIRRGDPNGAGLPEWPAVARGGNAEVMWLDAVPRAEAETHRDRYLLLDQISRRRAQ